MRQKITIDYALLCPDFNTTYLDRDNTDPKTVACMHAIIDFFDELLDELKSCFDLSLYRVGHNEPQPNSALCTNRFLFYSLEKEITKQNFLLSKPFQPIDGIDDFFEKGIEGVFVTNDKMGEATYLYVDDSNKIGRWLLERLEQFDREALA